MQPKERLGSAKYPVATGPTGSAAGEGDHGPASAGDAERRPTSVERPLLMVDIDGVISLFAGEHRLGTSVSSVSFHSIEGIPHFLSASAAAHLHELGAHFELVWASGWEERANEHLPHLLGLPADLPFLRFARAVGRSNAHWKLDAIDGYAGARPLAWIDDALTAACHDWAGARSAPTLLVQTDPALGLTAREAGQLIGWARTLAGG
jgi:hypothetical protein